ncbi:MAG: HNH endonuclease [Chloroflexi bacterium]|nr:HNH endonuclease [Chloroflexota bacterium]
MIGSICEIPLYGKGGEVVGRTRVDPDDWFALARYRWNRTAQGYAVSRMRTRFRRDGVRGKKVGPVAKPMLMHRLIAAAPDKPKVDHINRDRLDNRRANLRAVDNGANSQNQTPQHDRSSKYRGVHYYKARQKWTAKVQVGGVVHQLGYFTDELTAARAAAEYRAQHMPYSEEAAA